MNGSNQIDEISAATVLTEEKKSLSLLIIINQTFSKEQKQNVLQKLNSSLNQLNDDASSNYIVNLKEELNYVIKAYQQDFSNYEQEYRVASKNENFEFELLINSTQSSFKKAIRSFLQSSTKIKNFIYAGIDFNGNPNLTLQDSLVSYDDFNLLFQEYISTVGDALKTTNYNFNFNSKYIHESQLWKNLEKSVKNFKFLTLATVSVADAILNDLASYVSKFLNDREISDIMEETKITGALNVEKPALYIFPAREGDCSFFTFNGYSILVNGGYDRVNPSFWRFASMLKQIDSVMFTHQDSDALGGLSSLFAKKLVQPNVKPNILSVFGNLSKPKVNDHDVDVISSAIDQLKIELHPLVKRQYGNLKPNQQPEHVNLYFKHGYGSLDLYVLSPFENSAEYKEFINQTQNKVQSNIQKSSLNVNQTFKSIPVSHLCSAVVVLVWKPVKVGENAVRILYTGNAPQNIIINALDRIKDFDLLQAPVYKIKSEIQPAVASKKKQQKPKIVDNADKPIPVVQNGGEKKAAAKVATTENGKNEKQQTAATNQNNQQAAPKHQPATNGANANKPPNKPPTSGPSKPPVATPSTQNKRESTAGASNTEATQAKKPEVPKKQKERKDETTKDEQHKEEKKPVAARPPVPKKDEAKPKPETSTRVSTAPVASKSEHNTKPTTSTAAPPAASKSETKAAAPAQTKSRPSTSKPNVKSEVKDEKDVKKPVEKVAVAAPKPVKPVTDNKPKQSVSKDTKTTASKPSAAAKTEVKKEEIKSSITDGLVASASSTPILAPCQVLVETVAMDIEVQPQPQLNLLVEPLLDNISNQNSEGLVEPKVVNIVDHNVGDLNEQEDVRKDDVVENKFEFEPSECVEKQIEDKVESNNHQEELRNDQQICFDNIDERVIYHEESPHLSPISSNENFVLQETEVESQGCRHENLKLCLDDANVPAPDEQDFNRQNTHEDHHHYEESPHLSPISSNENFGLHEAEVDNPLQPLVVEQPELIITPHQSGDVTPNEEYEKPVEDIMTRSFIDNGENQIVNPFVQNLSKTSEQDWTSLENSIVNEPTNNVNQESLTTEFDSLINGIQSINIENATQEQTKVTTPNSSDPSTWNLLNLPKPVNPSETTTNDTEKKPSTPNIKREPLSTSSPSTAAKKEPATTETGKSVKASLNISVNKPNSSNKAQQANGSSAPKLPASHPLYFEVSYIPAHGNQYYVDTEFFKRVRARFYVLSSIEPSQNILNALLDAKQTWEDKELLVSIIPTYESDTLRHWFMLNEEQLARHKIDVLPAANLSTLTIDNNSDFSCNVHKLDF